MKLIKFSILLILLITFYQCKSASKVTSAAMTQPPSIGDKDSVLYTLVHSEHKVDFDYNWLKQIDNAKVPYPTFDGKNKYAIGNLKTIAGSYTVQRYYGSFMGKTSNGKKQIDNMLILKLSPSKKILDAFHYNLSWQDSPSIALYRMSKIKRDKATYLMNNLKLQKLSLKSFLSKNKNSFDIGGSLAVATSQYWQSININKDEIRKKGNFMLFEPSRRVRRSRYHTYYFPLQEYNNKFGSVKKNTKKKLLCFIGTKTREKYFNKYGENPSGGFTLDQTFCDHIKVVP